VVHFTHYATPTEHSTPAPQSIRTRPKRGTGTHGGSCVPGYHPCIAPGPDVDCAGGGGDGPRFVRGPIRVTGRDPYLLDENGDGVGCN
jgi:hypothetical protein